MPATVHTETIDVRLPGSLVKEMRQLVASGAAGSETDLVQEAIERQINRIRRARLREEFKQAADDPEFANDMKDIEAAFRSTDAETARMIDAD